MKAVEALVLLVILGAGLIAASVMVGRHILHWWKNRRKKTAPWDSYVDYSQQGFINYYAVRGAAQYGVRSASEMQHIGTAPTNNADRNIALEIEMDERVAFLNSQQRRLLKRVKGN